MIRAKSKISSRENSWFREVPATTSGIFAPSNRRLHRNRNHRCVCVRNPTCIVANVRATRKRRLADSMQQFALVVNRDHFLFDHGRVDHCDFVCAQGPQQQNTSRNHNRERPAVLQRVFHGADPLDEIPTSGSGWILDGRAARQSAPTRGQSREG